MFRRLLQVRYIVYALIALGLTLCTIEIGLQVHANRYGSMFSESAMKQLTVASWQSHHQLRPNTRTVIRNTDSNSQIEIRTNSFGLRGPEPLVPKSPDVYRIVCLGDDTVFAGEVDENDSLTQRLQGFLASKTQRRIEVVNAGVPGFCPLLSCLQYRTSLAVLEADLVILNFDMTDVADDHKYRRLVQTGPNDEPVGCSHPSLFNNNRPQTARMLDQFQLSRLAKKHIEHVMNQCSPTANVDIESPAAAWSWISNDPPDWSIYIRHALGPIIHLRQQTQKRSTQFILACSPAPWQVSAQAGSDELRSVSGIPLDTVYSSRRPFELLAAVARKYNIEFFDPTTAFRRIPNSERLFLGDSRGFSRYGHALYAHELADFLIRNVPSIQNRTIRSQQPVFRQAIDRREISTSR
jgi:hypothetical protein